MIRWILLLIVVALIIYAYVNGWGGQPVGTLDVILKTQ